MADGWNMPEVAAALPTADQPAAEEAAEKKNPQEAGWVPKQSYDYDTYNKSGKEMLDESIALGGIQRSQWASDAARYEWNDEFGDVGPRFEDLEKELFGDEFRPRQGIDFSKIQEIEVHQEGSIRINPVRSFDDAGLHPVMRENVRLAGYTIPTPVQAYCLPTIFKGHDIVACAQTGSGKTAAFLVPILSKLMGKAKKLAAPRPNPALFRPGIDAPFRAEPLLLVVCPSRELAQQIFDEARRLCYRSMLRPCVIYGGGPVGEQMKQLALGCDVLIGTPGRLCDFIERPHVLSLRRLKYVVIDEADEMLNADWETELNKIMSGGDQEEGNITFMMFSATFPKSARELATQHLAHDHVLIRVGRAGSTHAGIKQNVVFVESAMKRQALVDLIYANPPARTLIFVNSKRAADEVDDYLFNLDLPCTSIHSDRTQKEREDALRAFRTGKCPIMIATGVTARGIDVKNVMHVINYDLPNSAHGGIEEYVHRIGRTARIGNQGLATSFYNDRDSDLAEHLTKMLLETNQEVPDFLQQHIPEGYVPGQALNFEADEEGEANDGDANGDTATGQADAGGDAWASEAQPAAAPTPAAAATTGWGAPAEPAAAPVSAPAAMGGWGAPAQPAPAAAPAAAATNGWGAPAQPAPPSAPVPAAAPMSNWGAAPPTAPGPAAATAAWNTYGDSNPMKPQVTAAQAAAHAAPVNRGMQASAYASPAAPAAAPGWGAGGPVMAPTAGGYQPLIPTPAQPVAAPVAAVMRAPAPPADDDW